ncbi:MAG: thiol-disulfide oxidoreductase [Gemmatimonadetes bacterium]|jgi:predicted DCC family thiol-disulfide oxidoreductase YuxK|nr:thiol-disulfide oxidoreductase [Gemmatimonadota bacterium]
MTVPVVRFTVAGDADLPSTGLGREYTVVFDGDCKVCTRLSALLREWDAPHRLEVVSSQQPGVMARFPWIPARAYAGALQLVAADGTTWQGSAAIEQLLTVLPRGRLIAWVFAIPFARTLADRFYRWFARNRYKLGCGSHCQSRPLDVMWAEAEKAGR